MKITYFDTYEAMSLNAGQLIFDKLLQKPEMLFCAASGSSPYGTYAELVNKYKSDPDVFSKMRILKLDEWGGIPMSDPQTCESFLQENLISPLNIPPERFYSFDSNPENPKKECETVNFIIRNNGSIDLCVLGLGLNGHIAFNEPASCLIPDCHVTNLSVKSMEHPMAVKMKEKPTFGLTIGMADILQSQKILILITGNNKDHILKRFLSKEITTKLPASFLWLHNDVTCFLVN